MKPLISSTFQTSLGSFIRPAAISGPGVGDSSQRMDTNKLYWISAWMTFVRGASKSAGFVQPNNRPGRRPLRIYEPGEPIPQPGQKPRIIMDQKVNDKFLKFLGPSEKDKESGILFSKIMGAIVDNKKRKYLQLEGSLLVQEALKTGNKLEELFLVKSIKEVPKEIQALLNKDANILRVSEELVQKWSSVKTPPGIIGTCRKPNLSVPTRQEGQQQSQPSLTVMCDNLREPGNLGSILRSAAGAGCKQILLSKGCVDAWESKVLRGGCGAHFHLPIVTDIALENLGNFIESSTESQNEPGNSQLSTRSTAILLADSNTIDSRSTLPIYAYTDLNYAKYDDIYLIIGGETEGLGDETLKTASRFTQRVQFPLVSEIARIHIPLQNDFNSLNAANAFGVILFEIVRQLNVGRK